MTPATEGTARLFAMSRFLVPLEAGRFSNGTHCAAATPAQLLAAGFVYFPASRTWRRDDAPQHIAPA